MARDDGGNAFPQAVGVSPAGDVYTSSEVAGHAGMGGSGMSLRDWFAGQALAGLLAGNQGQNQNELAWLAYTAADAMLAARKTEGE